jgi:cobalt-zinc-cadmium efflux system outer membrane protein
MIPWTRCLVTLGPALALVMTVACVRVEPRPDFDQARDLIRESTGRAQVFDSEVPVPTEEELEALLADGLSLDEAQRLALINNRELLAEFQEIGVAHTDWVQSRLLSNPSLDVLLRFPLEGGRGLLEAGLGVELLELWRIPARADAARRGLEATVLRIARRAGEELADARRAYFAAVAAEELERVAREHVELVARSFEAVRALHEAGAADALDESLARGPLLSARLALQVARIEAADARRALAKELSIERPVELLLLTDPLPEPPALECEPEALVLRARAARLDLRAFEAALVGLEAQVRLEERRAFGDVAAGVSLERPADSGDELVGPALDLTLPLFDQNQAQVARAGFKLEQMVRLREAAVVFVAQDVRSGADRLNTASRNLAFYRAEVLPQAELSLALASESHAAGRTSLLTLLEVQRQLLEARRGQVVLRLEAAAALAELERAVGAPLPGTAENPSAPAGPAVHGRAQAAGAHEDESQG